MFGKIAWHRQSWLFLYQSKQNNFFLDPVVMNEFFQQLGSGEQTSLTHFNPKEVKVKEWKIEKGFFFFLKGGGGFEEGYLLLAECPLCCAYLHIMSLPLLDLEWRPGQLTVRGMPFCLMLFSLVFPYLPLSMNRLRPWFLAKTYSLGGYLAHILEVYICVQNLTIPWYYTCNFGLI